MEYCHTNPRDHFSITVMNCHRSGIYKSEPKGQRKRQLKSQGTIKLGFSCTAQIRLREFKTHVEVFYFPEHYRHEKSLCHLPLSKIDRKIIAEKLMQGVDERKILQDLRLSMNTGMERRHLTTRKDLNNIKRDFGISNTTKDSTTQNDEQGVYTWVEEMRQTNYNPVLFYKRQHEECFGLEKDEFILVLMTMFQKTVISEFNYDRICIDTISGICNYGFEVVILFAANENEEGIPIAFCITSSINQNTLHTFFNCIKNIVVNIKPAYFISEDNPLYYTTWIDEFGPCKANVISSWHVEQAWRKHLTTIKKKEKREEIRSFLKKLLYEYDQNVFTNLLKEFVSLLSQYDDTSMFLEYFMANYYERCSAWAYCFRKCKKSDPSNMSLETFHKNIKRWYLDGKINKRIDNCIIKLINLANDKKFNDFLKSKIRIKTEEMIITCKNVEESTANNDIESIECDIAVNNDIDNVEWDIVSESGASYRVSKENENHINSSNFKCSCYTFSTSNQACKHVNFVLDYINSNQTTKIENHISLESIKAKMLSLNEKFKSIQNVDDKMLYKMHIFLKDLQNLLDPYLIETSVASTCELTSDNVIEPVEFFSVKKPRLNNHKPETSTEEQISADALLKKITDYNY